MKKYELTDETIVFRGRTLHQIRAIRAFSNIKAGELGGWIEKEENLSHNGNAWVAHDANVCENAYICDNAVVADRAAVYGNARIAGDAVVLNFAIVCENAMVYGKAIIHDAAMVFGNAEIYDYADIGGNSAVFGKVVIFGNAEIINAKVHNQSDYIVFKNFWSSGRYFTWTRSNNMWVVGCFYGTSEELIEKAYKDSAKSGREYERVVRYVESILADVEK